MESYSKNDSVVETPGSGVCEQLPLLSAGLSAQLFFSPEDYDYLRAQRIIGMWMSSKVCSLQFVCDSDFYPAMMKTTHGSETIMFLKLWINIRMMINTTLTTYNI